MRKWLIRILPVLTVVAVSCTSEPAETVPPVVETPKEAGLVLAEKYCASCHKLPDPSMLDSATWHNNVLVRMGAYMGIFYDNVKYYDTLPAKWLEPGEGGERVLAAGVYPTVPKLTRDEYQQIRTYFLSHAPKKLPPASLVQTEKNFSRFRVKPLIQSPQFTALVTAVHISEQEQGIYAGFYKQSLVKANAAGKISGQMAGLVAPVFIQTGPEGITVADIGNIRGADTPIGKFMRGKNFSALSAGNTTFSQTKLMRPVYGEWADLDDDGDEDLLLCEYGNLVGNLCWYRNDGGKYEKQVLFPDDGCITARFLDMNGDGKKDIVSLMANSDEGIDVYINKGGGNFERTRVLRFDPVYGCAALEPVDFDNDGDTDLMLSNGDNGDYPAIPKPYHGVRLFRNEGSLAFTEAFFLPQHGAYGTRTADFDGDGDKDIASVSFYPDFSAHPEQAFLYFENQGNGAFRASTFAQVSDARWMVMDDGDMDADGDLDLILGAFNAPSSEVPKEKIKDWDQKNLSVMLLENTTK